MSFGFPFGRLFGVRYFVIILISSFMTDHRVCNQSNTTGVSELVTLPKHTNSPPEFSGVRIARSLVFCVVFSRSLFVLVSFVFWPLYCLSFFHLSFDHCIVCPFSIYGFWLSLWYLQTFLLVMRSLNIGWRYFVFHFIRGCHLGRYCLFMKEVRYFEIHFIYLILR